MKRIFKQAVAAMSLLLLTSITVLTSCGGSSSNPSPEDKLKGSLAKTWILNTAEAQPVTVDDYNKTPDYENFALTIASSGTYTIADNATESVWPDTGSFIYSDITTTNNTTTFKMTRQDNLVITCTLANNTLSMSFTFDENANQGNRVSGQWKFALKVK